ncbi:unnamed protein product [Cuscuta epithymum]|uniref:F-box domain-containing protein n=1 Tax=Cuscuta epithymum TaxID=186058 RepID=A0AAV0EP46_9ASTE|nr:unnamed protein product [Cuscuta epithymum]
MARRRRSKPGSDLISQLPEDLKHKILERLDTRSAAKTALFSRQWKDVWLRHGQLVFGWEDCPNGGRDEDDFKFLVKTITNVLLLRTGPVKIFSFSIYRKFNTPEQSDLDGLCLFLSKNGIEQLHLSILPHPDSEKLTIPACIFSCPTIKRLYVDAIDFYGPVCAPHGSILSGVTSIIFTEVEFKAKASGTLPVNIPNLEELSLCWCHRIDNFVFSAPKLKSLIVVYANSSIELKWFELHLLGIKNLSLTIDSVLVKPEKNIQEWFPTAMNLQVIKLHGFAFLCQKHIVLVIQLLKKCPNLLELGIEIKPKSQVSYEEEEEEADFPDLSIPKDPNRWFDDQDLRKLKSVKMQSFNGSREEVAFIKTILSRAPALEEIIIKESVDIDASLASKFRRKMTTFARASSKAEVIFTDTKYLVSSLKSLFPNF